MTNDVTPHNLAEIHDLLLAAFSAEELRRFCNVRRPFRPIADRFRPDDVLVDMVDKVLDYCDRHVLLDVLLAEVKAENPGQYKRFEPQLYLSAPTASQLQEGGNHSAPPESLSPTAKRTRKRFLVVSIIALVGGGCLLVLGLLTRMALPREGLQARAYRNDDADIILVNDHIVGVTVHNLETDWINISTLFTKDYSPDYVTFVNLNGPGPGDWGFAIKSGEQILWENAGRTDESYSIGYRQILQVLPDMRLQEVDLIPSGEPPIDGSWTVGFEAGDIGLVLVNSIPAFGTYEGRATEFGAGDISELLSANRTNVITFVVWSSSQAYYWDITLERDTNIIWSSKSSGTGKVGEVLFISILVDGNGNLVNE